MGGVEAYLEALARILAEDMDVHVLCVMPELQQRMDRCGVEVTRMPKFSRARILRFTTAMFLMMYLVVRNRIDIVQINGFFESVLLLPVRLLAKDAFYTRHGPFELDLFPWYRRPFKYVPRMLSRYVAHLATRIICVSDTVGALYKPLFPPGRVVVIPNWISSLPVPRNYATQEKRPIRILCIGRLEKYKGVQLLIEAVCGMADVDVTIVGDGAYRQELERQAAGSNVRFVGFHQDPTPFYRHADIFVMPSFGPEGLPMVALEAMSQSLACVFSDLPVLLEITDEGRAAAIFRRGDVTDLKQKLNALLNSQAERERIGRAAYDIVKLRYHEPVVRRAYLQVFSSQELLPECAG
jgi:glycosyltransferase involved in cell wall biosynthesis